MNLSPISNNQIQSFQEWNTKKIETKKQERDDSIQRVVKEYLGNSGCLSQSISKTGKVSVIGESISDENKNLENSVKEMKGINFILKKYKDIDSRKEYNGYKIPIEYSQDSYYSEEDLSANKSNKRNKNSNDGWSDRWEDNQDNKEVEGGKDDRYHPTIEIAIERKELDNEDIDFINDSNILENKEELEFSLIEDKFYRFDILFIPKTFLLKEKKQNIKEIDKNIDRYNNLKNPLEIIKKYKCINKLLIMKQCEILILQEEFENLLNFNNSDSREENLSENLYKRKAILEFCSLQGWVKKWVGNIPFLGLEFLNLPERELKKINEQFLQEENQVFEMDGLDSKKIIDKKLKIKGSAFVKKKFNLLVEELKTYLTYRNR